MLRQVLLLCLAAAWAMDPAAEAGDPVPTSSPIPPPGPGDEAFVLRSVRVQPSTRSLLATGWVNQTQGAVELLACGPGGKTHESVFVLNVSPLDVQAGLLLLGLKPGRPLPALGEGPPEGARLELWVDWEVGGTSHSERAERFVYNTETKAPLPPTDWTFTGSIMEDGHFKALAEESLVATYWDPWAIVNLPLLCGSNDEILAVNRWFVPPNGTAVTLRMKVPAE